ncbi:AraC family transcriptional regulator [Streptomyces sp. NBC_01808]|uniref:AraC family transcriptional regulator n=1 Tax=Streptomyces sp. NBC_01808 TaxID=2975947 RepID=UPI002DD804D7|nr:AraC family transcriptional regulator [Streptomyces sp. NBC_01808]WSA36263.1 AraC family transcriptional regulator [Streptomyces sp. NBC_01808]
MTKALTFMSGLLDRQEAESRLIAWVMDVIADMLSAPQGGGAEAATLRASAPWGIKHGRAPSVSFHLVTHGLCWLRIPGMEPIRLGTGDLALLPNSAGHALASDRQGALLLVDGVLRKRTDGAGSEIDIAGEGPRTRAICAGYRARHPLPAPLRAMMPPALHLSAQQLSARRDLADALRMLSDATTTHLPGSAIIVDRLVDVVAVHMLRSWLPADLAATWPTLHRDLAVATAVTALHQELGRPWTLDELAEKAGLSRATLTRRFNGTLGESPLRYLRRRRMELAARRLRETDDSLARIAQHVGYRSEFAFSRAFSQTIGMAPGRYRMDSRQQHGRGRSDPPSHSGVT